MSIDGMITRYLTYSDDQLGSFRIHRLVTSADPDEVAILGSSRAFSNYDAASIDSRAFNYGIPAAGFGAVKFQLNKVLERGGSAPVIINTDLGWWSMTGIGDLAAYVPSVHDADVRKLIGDRYRIYHHLPFARYFGLYQNYVTERASNWIRGRDRSANFDPEQFAHHIEAMREWNISHEPDSSKLASLLRLVDRHPDRHLFFVVAPYHPAYFEVASYSDSSEVWLNELDSRPHVTVVDFSRRVYADTLFFDAVHMNPAGAIVFSRDLREEIDSLLNL